MLVPVESTQELGKQLREARLREGLALRDVEARLKVRTKYLRALEWERFDLLPNDKTARRILLAYAECLELDQEACLTDYDSRPRSVEPPAPAAESRRPREGTRRMGMFAILLPALPALIAVPLVLVYQGGSSRHHPAAPRSEPAAGTLATSAVRPSRATPGATRTRAHSAPSTPKLVAARHPARLEIAATRGDSWLLIRSSSPQGKILFQGTLARGRSVRFQKGRLWIRVGAASNVDLRANGVRPRVTLYGTFDAIVTAAGLSKVPLAGGLPGP